MHAHKRGTSDIAAIAASAAEAASQSASHNGRSESLLVQNKQNALLNKSRSNPSFTEGDEKDKFKSADPLTSSVTTSLLCTDSPNSVAAAALSSAEDMEVEKINTPARPIQPITINARAPVAAKGQSNSSHSSKRLSTSDKPPPSSSGSSPKPGSIASARYSLSTRSTASTSESAPDDIDPAAPPSAAELKKLNRRPSSSSLAALLAAENGGQVVAPVATNDGEDDIMTSSWMKRNGSGVAGQDCATNEIGKGTVEKLRSSFTGVSLSGRSIDGETVLGTTLGSSATRPTRPRWTHSISSSSATLAITASSSPGLRPELIVRKFSSSLSAKSSAGGEEGASTSPVPFGAAVPSVSNDIANRCAAALKMDKATFLSLQPEGPVKLADGLGGEEQYSFVELVRRNFTKEYLGLVQSDLEKYLSDEDFLKVFQKDKVGRIFPFL